MKKKIFILTCVLIMGFCIGFGVVTYARHHLVAGVDYPYDASTYYNPTVIDAADSAPSSYALKDLAANGGTVYDYTRHIKSILFGGYFEKIFGSNNDEINNEQQNLEHLSNDTKNQANNYLTNIGNQTTQMNTGIDLANTSAFITQNAMEDEGADLSNYSLETKMNYLTNAYAILAQASNNGSLSSEDILANTNYLLQVSNSVKGDMQAAQTTNYMDANLVDSYARMNQMIANLIQLRAAYQLNESDTNFRTKATDANFKTSFADPYNEQEYENQEKRTGHTRLKVETPDF